MSNDDKPNQIRKDISKKKEIIEEKIGNTSVNFSEVFKLYQERVLLKKSKILFSENELIDLDVEEKNKFKISGPLKDLMYGEEKVNFPIIVTFEKNKLAQTYKIYTQKYLDQIYDGMKFEHSLLLVGNSCKKYDKKKECLFTKLEKDKNYLITENFETAYEKYFSGDISILDQDICDTSELTPNFEYYFLSPKPSSLMSFILSPNRKKAIDSIMNFENKKINSIYGPYGNGKTTTLIMISRLINSICYLNLNALHIHKEEIRIWKYKIFLLELYNMLKDQKEHFNKIKEVIYDCNHFWEGISLSIKYCITNKINTIFILDQFKEDIDPKFEKFLEIKKLVNSENNNYVKIIVSSSINNLDIRDFIIQKYIDKKSKNSFINEYYYIRLLFQLSDIDGLIDTLTTKQKEIFENYFSNVPIYFYYIKDSDDNNIYKIVDDIKNNIIDDIKKFYMKNELSIEDLSFIIKNLTEIKLSNNERKKMNKDIIKKFIQILPIKYFSLDIEEDEILDISYYFNLAKTCFLEFLISKIYSLLEQPKLQIPERLIGDLLEVIIIDNLKSNLIEKFDQVCKVNSIWDMKSVKELDKEKVNDNNLLIIQEDDDAKYIDIGFLLKGETLILAQCKKCLGREPKNYITIKKLINYKDSLYNFFQTYFNCEIKKIKLFYMTGIYFTNYSKYEYISWSSKDYSYKYLEQLTSDDNIPLVYYDVQAKKLFIKKEEKFECCSITGYNSLICNENIYNFVKIVKENEEIKEILEGMKNQFESQTVNLMEKSKIEKGTGNRIDNKIYQEHLNRKLILDKIFSVENPDASYLINKNSDILTTFEMNNKKCFSFYDEDKKQMQYREINDGRVSEFSINDVKIYFLQKKVNRNDKETSTK